MLLFSSPRGYYYVVETDDASSLSNQKGEEKLEIDDECKALKVAELTRSLVNWVHHAPHMLTQGRCTWYKV